MTNIQAGTTAEKTFGDAIIGIGAGWWHWFPSSWLIVDHKGRDLIWWRDYLKTTVAGLHLMVMHIQDTREWAGTGDPRIFDWMNDTWMAADSDT